MMTNFLQLLDTVAVEAKPVAAMTRGPTTPRRDQATTYDQTTDTTKEGTFADLRQRLESGDLNGFGWAYLPDGTWVVQPAAYCRALLAELRWPPLAANAKRHLRLLRRALMEIDSRAAQEG